MERILIAFGGNALLRNGDDSSYEMQLRRATEAMEKIWKVVLDNEVIITHGNGPQVGNILLQNEHSRDITHPMPLHACGSMSQGLIGEILITAYDEMKTRYGVSKDAAVIFTRTVVNEEDEAFHNPSKPIGPYYSSEDAGKYMKESGWVMKEEPGKGFRRVVPSPYPVDIAERSAIFSMLTSGYLPICVGGGGIPVIKTVSGYRGVDAVIDKDLASSLMANILEAHKFVILTDVDGVYLRYGKPDQEKLARISAGDLRKLYTQGSFPGGSIGPKVRAALEFVERNHGISIIGSLDDASNVIAGKSGTVVY
ncbi:MAG: carbamate kinase [Candidatus Thermoplasmatota archaeon]|jgi:carbamate kinase|nr:carbamate kinase [Candidatus Thermoplasmatota archaeon]